MGVFRQSLPDKKIPEYRKWHDGILAAQRLFDGYLGTTTLEEPSDAQGETVHITISRWSCGASALRWKQSQERETCLQHLGELMVGHAFTRYDVGDDAYFLLGDVPVRKGRTRCHSFKECII